MKEAVLRLIIFLFSAQTHFEWESLASKLLILKHYESSTQRVTLLVVSPGSLYMNTSIENIVCVHRVY